MCEKITHQIAQRNHPYESNPYRSHPYRTIAGPRRSNESHPHLAHHNLAMDCLRCEERGSFLARKMAELCTKIYLAHDKKFIDATPPTPHQTFSREATIYPCSLNRQRILIGHGYTLRGPMGRRRQRQGQIHGSEGERELIEANSRFMCA